MSDYVEGKHCTKCDQWKPYSEYQRNRSKTDGYQTYCRPCLNAANAAARAKNADYWREHYRQRMRDTYADKREDRLANSAAWYAEKGREWHKQRRHSDPERYREATRRWQRKNNNSSNAIRRRRANKVGNGGSHTEAQWQALVAQYGGRCLCCGRIPTGLWPDVLTRDHIVPLKHGGTDDIANIQPLCNFCNVTKGDRHSTDYRPSENKGA